MGFLLTDVSLCAGAWTVMAWVVMDMVVVLVVLAMVVMMMFLVMVMVSCACVSGCGGCHKTWAMITTR